MEEPKEKDETWWGANGFETKVVRERSFMGDRYFRLFSYRGVTFSDGLRTCNDRGYFGIWSLA